MYGLYLSFSDEPTGSRVKWLARVLIVVRKPGYCQASAQFIKQYCSILLIAEQEEYCIFSCVFVILIL